MTASTFPAEPNEYPEDSTPHGVDKTSEENGHHLRIKSNSDAPSQAKTKPRRNRLRRFHDGQESKWWFASTGIPLLAATLGPLANMASIAALVTSWRSQKYIDGTFVSDFNAIPFADPRWCYWLNVGSLILGFLGNLFLLFNFTQRIRYIIALPATILLWYLATAILIGIVASMHMYTPAQRGPYQTYTQGFWYAIAAASLYLLCSMLLMLNMLGFFLGHYPDNFALSEAQRTLILQTMLFFIWLGGGAAVFARVEQSHGASGWGYVDAMYFCDVTILTVGFGDLYPTSDLGRGLVFPYSVGGIVTLALIVSSIYRFMRDLGEENIVQKHTERMRKSTVSRMVTNSIDLRDKEHEEESSVRKRDIKKGALKIGAPEQPRAMRHPVPDKKRWKSVGTMAKTFGKPRKPRMVLLREEKDRFEAMRNIQLKSRKFKQWIALTISIAAFGILWCVGAVVFWEAERAAQGMTYFQALYFCYVSLLTIGYGDLSPKSNAGRVFFVVWSLIAVPTMTILISDMGDTVIARFRKLSDELADFTVLPKEGIWKDFLDRHPWLLNWLQNMIATHAEERRLKQGFETADLDSPNVANSLPVIVDVEEQLNRQTMDTGPLQDSLNKEPEIKALSSVLLARRLAISIKRVAADLRLPHRKRYDFEDWVEFTDLIRHCHRKRGIHSEDVAEENEREEESLVEWDWIGEKSPLTSADSEAEWLLDKLCESLVKLGRREEVGAKGRDGDGDNLRRGDSRIEL